MEIRKCFIPVKSNNKKAIMEVVFTNYIIYVFQGRLSRFDIVVKYKKDDKHNRMRTPKHIHWAVDILMKMQGNEVLTKRYLRAIYDFWNACQPLANNDFDTLRSLIHNVKNSIKIEQYFELNSFGEYDVEFLFVLMELLAVQEKTNRADAYMFGNIIKELLKSEIDIFKILSIATFGGQNRFKR